MTTLDDILQKRLLEEAEYEAYKRRQLTENGAARSRFDDLLQLTEAAFGERTDDIVREAVQNTMVVLRQIFSQNTNMRMWIGNGEGLTDVAKSEIIIESAFSPRIRDDDLTKPKLFVTAGGGTFTRMHNGNLKHWDRLTGTRTYTGLGAGVITIEAQASEAADALALASFVVRNLLANWREFSHQRWHDIRNISHGGADPNNPVLHRPSSKTRSSVCPVVFTFYQQWTIRSTPKDGTFSTVSEVLTGLREVDEDEDSNGLGFADVLVNPAELDTELTIYAIDEFGDDG